MNELNAFSLEIIGQTLLSQNDKGLDLLQLLLNKVYITEIELKNITSNIELIKRDTKEINFKLDMVMEKIDKLEDSFKDLKNENRDIEQKIALMVSKLTKIEQFINEEELEDFYSLCQSIYYNWDEFDELTRKFIPVAEYLFSRLQKFEKLDYSPVILEFCKAIENELLLKIFKRYTFDLIMRKKQNLEAFLSNDRADSSLSDKTGIFVKTISKALKSKKAQYTLGQMNTIMLLMKQPDIVSKSPLLQDFSIYLTKNTSITELLDVNYLNNIEEIVFEYRNPSAHPEFMTLEKAKQCKEQIPYNLDYLIDCVNK